MEFKYFHGTSTIFLDSIKANGLGKINPNIDFRNLDVLKYLTNIAENNIRNNSEYLILRDTCLAMVNQTALRVNHENGNSTLLNYRHDGIYVAISLQRAVIYSAFNKFGSEILERCVMLYKLLEKLGIMFQIPENLNLFGIEKYLDCHPSPIIVEITKIDDENLESEHGRKAKEALDF